MLKRIDTTGRALAIVGLLLAAAGCGVHGYKLNENVTGAAGDGSGFAGTGAAGDGSGFAGTSGAAGTIGPSGVAGTTGSAGDTGSGSAGTSGNAGTTGAAGSVGPTGTAGTTGAAGTGAAGTGVASGVTINIGGTNVPKEDVIAFIHFGHSNMAGRGMNPTASRPYHFMQSDPHAWMYHAASQGPFPAGAKAGFELALEPKTGGDARNVRNAATPYGGPGTVLVKQAAALAPGKYFVSLGFGQASAYCTQYLPGALYYDKLSAAAKELKGKVTFGAIMIYLGITERHGTTADIQNFPSCINQLVTAIRTDLGEPNLPVLINGYEMGATRTLAPTGAFAQAIIPRIAAIPTTVSNSAVIPTDNPIIPIEVEPSEPDGDHHFTLDGHKEYTRRLLQTMKDKGWWHW